MEDFKLKKSGDKYILLLSVLLILISGFIWYSWQRPTDLKVAVIRQNGQLINTINLETITEPYEIEIKSADGGYNRLRLEAGRLRIIAASCPTQVCVKQGWISKNGQSIVCLPHKLVITIQSQDFQEIDGVVR